jgi:hypothetical protein
MSKIKEFSKLVITGATWDQVVASVTDPGFAPGFAAAPDGWWTLARKALADVGWEVDDAMAQGVILSSDRPGFGAVRDVEYATAYHRIPEIRDDATGGSWRVLPYYAVHRAIWASGASGSSIEIFWCDGRGWTITGSFPVVDGIRYEGTYYQAFMHAASM